MSINKVSINLNTLLTTSFDPKDALESTATLNSIK